jgi:hypothetical protein
VLVVWPHTMATQHSNPAEYRQHIHHSLAARLADACANPSYMPDLWAVYYHRFAEVLAAELTGGSVRE